MFMLEFVGAVLRVAGAVDLSDLAFVFGPHLLEETDLRETALSVHFARVAGGREVRVHDRDGVLLRRRAFHGFGGIPPLLPPFAVMNGRYAVAQAAVLSKDGTVLALMGGIGSNRNEVALALSARGWSVVSGRKRRIQRGAFEQQPHRRNLAKTRRRNRSHLKAALPFRSDKPL